MVRVLCFHSIFLKVIKASATGRIKGRRRGRGLGLLGMGLRLSGGLLGLGLLWALGLTEINGIQQC